MKLKSLHVAMITILFIFSSIGLSSALGIWKTTNSKVPMTYKEGEFTGDYNPADIRGSYTFGDIFTSFKIPVDDLGKAFGIKDPTRYASFQCKELESMYSDLALDGKEIGTGSVRYFVALYKGLPFNIEEEIYLPKPALEILKTKSNLTQEQIESIEKHSVDLPEISSETPASLPETTDTEKIIKGSTTFKSLLDWGVQKEEIEKIIGDNITNPGITIKDFASSKGIEFSTLKKSLQELIDRIQK